MISSTEGKIMPVKRERGKDQTKWTKYRWEFMRHNSEYKKAYVEVKILRSRSAPSPDKAIKTKHTVNYPYLNTASAQKEKNFVRSLGFILTA